MKQPIFGLEPKTCWLQVSCSANWAISASYLNLINYITKLKTYQAVNHNKSLKLNSKAPFKFKSNINYNQTQPQSFLRKPPFVYSLLLLRKYAYHHIMQQPSTTIFTRSKCLFTYYANCSIKHYAFLLCNNLQEDLQSIAAFCIVRRLKLFF